MKRSEINSRLKAAEDFLAAQHFLLRPFAWGSPSDWRPLGPEVDEIRRRKLGSGPTDFGSGRFDEVGLLLFTLRNGDATDPDAVKTYAEKIMIVEQGQEDEPLYRLLCNEYPSGGGQ